MTAEHPLLVRSPTSPPTGIPSPESRQRDRASASGTYRQGNEGWQVAQGLQALQYLLTHSYSGKALAVRRVTENQGKNTPGVDQVIWTDPVSKEMAIHQLQKRG